MLYVAAWLSQPDPDDISDNAAGAGLVLFGPPVFVTLATLLAVGALGRRLWDRFVRTDDRAAPDR